MERHGPDDSDFKQLDEQSYAPVADNFEALTSHFLHRLAARMLDIGSVGERDHVLDVGTGTGLLARLATARSSHVIGIDQSGAMLDVARSAAARDGISSRITFRAMDAELLDLADGQFDVVQCLFVLKHLPDPQAAVHEMRRVLGTGGRLVLAVGARPHVATAAGFRTALDIAADRLRAALGRAALSPTSLRFFLAAEQVPPSDEHAAHSSPDVLSMVKAAGFSSVCRHWWSERHSLSPEDFWQVQAVFDSDASGALSRLHPDRIAELRSDYQARVRRTVQRGGSLIYRVGVDIYQAATCLLCPSFVSAM